MGGDGGGVGEGVAATELSVVYHCEFICSKISKKRHQVTEVNLCQL